MPIAINGSGTVTGISVGGLPDGIVDADMLAANAVTAGKLASGVGGKVLQVVQTLKTDTASITSSNTNNFVDISGMSLSITPTATTSKILVFFTICLGGNAGSFHIRLVRGSSNIAIGDSNGNRLTIFIKSTSRVINSNNCTSVCFVNSFVI